MSFDRRAFIRLAGVSAAAVAAAGCSPSGLLSGWSGFPAGDGSGISPRDWQLLTRMCYGVSSLEQSRVAQIGIGGWIEEQLSQDEPADLDLRWRLRNLDLIERRADELDRYNKQQVITGLRQATLLRQVYSQRQLYEMMVEFWSDHFNISMEKGQGWRLKIVDDREVIRPHVFANFRELLGASSRSPAMLVYLDNQANIKQAPNENYARELLELHTLGVDGGYSQADVMEMARCLTGWSVKEHFWRGDFTSNAGEHDPTPKKILGLTLEPDAEDDVDQVLDLLAVHPATAQHLAVKLIRRFVCDDPLSTRPELVSRAAEAFLRTGGGLRPMLRTVLLDGLVLGEPELPYKIKRPVDFLVSALRVLEAETDGGETLHDPLIGMGQPTFTWPTPDGPPDLGEIWMANLAPRWRFALALGEGTLDGTDIEIQRLINDTQAKEPDRLVKALAERVLGPGLPAETLSRINDAFQLSRLTDDNVRVRAVIAGLVASPQFQYR